MKRNLFAIGLALALALFAIPVFAGGWAVVTLDELPGSVVAGEPQEIGFMVRQHGRTPAGGLTPIITARLDGHGKPVTFVAEEDGEVGHYVATLNLPTEGQWQWEIDAFGMPQSMPALTVTAATVASQSVAPAPQPAPSLDVIPLLIGVVGLAGIALGMLILRSKRRWAIALVVAGLLVSGYGVVSAATQPKVEKEAKLIEAAPASAESPVELGRQLFIAKGCVVCHQHSEVRDYHVFEFSGIPDLTNIKVTPEYLRMWLKDPRSVKPATEMPMLGLSEAEIEALIAFLVVE